LTVPPEALIAYHMPPRTFPNTGVSVILLAAVRQAVVRAQEAVAS